MFIKMREAWVRADTITAVAMQGSRIVVESTGSRATGVFVYREYSSILEARKHLDECKNEIEGVIRDNK